MILDLNHSLFSSAVLTRAIGGHGLDIYDEIGVAVSLAAPRGRALLSAEVPVPYHSIVLPVLVFRGDIPAPSPLTIQQSVEMGLFLRAVVNGNRKNEAKSST